MATRVQIAVLILLLPSARASATPEADAMAEHDRLIGLVRKAVAANDLAGALDTLTKARTAAPGLQSDDMLAAGLCWIAGRGEEARAELKQAISRGPIDPFDLGAGLSGVAGQALAKTTLEREDVRKDLLDLLGETAESQALLGLGDRKVRNSVGMDIVRIRSGRFEVRVVTGLLRPRIEKREVTLTKPFYLGVTEVTQAQWRAVMGDNPSSFKGDDLPVTNVSWDDAMRFCRKLSEKEGKEYRLPTEAEWEYACRAGSADDTRYGPLDEIAWHGCNSFSISLSQSAQPVGRKKPNAWGLYDMLGNVNEWCSDWFGTYPSSLQDPTGAAHGDRDSTRVLRGGSWSDRAPKCFTASAGFCAPQACTRDDVGFRIARSP